jgi:hypothetical protein
MSKTRSALIHCLLGISLYSFQYAMEVYLVLRVLSVVFSVAIGVL